ncbi:rqcH [Symbiodinium sp. CCMP2456]|nr:rqcH [Symbiodinium sp. CCMP2456]
MQQWGPSLLPLRGLDLEGRTPKVRRNAAAPFAGCRCIEVTAADGSEWQILAGKTAEDNDRLSLKEGRSDEPWMHAADVPGSHVVVRQPGAAKLPAPSDVVQTAAGIAAFYSKAKGRRVKVHLTRCGQVSKAKGSPAGKVLLSGSVETLQVSPLDPASLQKPQTKKAKSTQAKRALLDPDKEAARLESLRAFRRKMNLERRIDVLDERIRAVDEEMALAGSDAELAAELLEKRQALETEQNTLFQDWEELEDASAGARHGKRPCHHS